MHNNERKEIFEPGQNFRLLAIPNPLAPFGWSVGQSVRPSVVWPFKEYSIETTAHAVRLIG